MGPLRAPARVQVLKTGQNGKDLRVLEEVGYRVDVFRRMVDRIEDIFRRVSGPDMRPPPTSIGSPT